MCLTLALKHTAQTIERCHSTRATLTSIYAGSLSRAYPPRSSHRPHEMPWPKLCVAALLASLFLAGSYALDTTICTLPSQSQPNPIASIYPEDVTGTMNGTLAILPIPLAQAQEIVGPRYSILTAAYHSLLPSFPADMYPAVLQAVREHDIQELGVVGIPDFSVCRFESFL